HARMRASLAGLDEGTFTEDHEFERKPRSKCRRRDWTVGCRRRRRRECWLSWDEGSQGRISVALPACGRAASKLPSRPQVLVRDLTIYWGAVGPVGGARDILVALMDWQSFLAARSAASSQVLAI